MPKGVFNLVDGDGPTVGEAISRHPDIDMVVCDINMPRMDGLTLLKKLQETDEKVLTIIVSAYGDMSNIRTAMNRGAFDFLAKSFENYQHIREHIDRARKIVRHFHDSALLSDDLKRQLVHCEDGASVRMTIVAGRKGAEPKDIPVSETLTAPATTGWEPKASNSRVGSPPAARRPPPALGRAASRPAGAGRRPMRRRCRARRPSGCACPRSWCRGGSRH